MPRCGAAAWGSASSCAGGSPTARPRTCVGELLAVESGPAGWVLSVRHGTTRSRCRWPTSSRARSVPPRPARAAPPHRALAVADLERVMAAALAGSRGRAAGQRGCCGRPRGSPTARTPCSPPGCPGARPGRGRRAGAGVVRRARSPRAGRRSRARSTRPRTPPSSPPSPRPSPRTAGAVIPDRGAFVLTAATAALAAPPGGAPPDPPGLRVRLAADAGRPAGSGCTTTAGSRCRRSRRRCWSRRPSRRSCRCSTATAPWPWAGGSLGGGWAGVTAVEVDAGYRRRGLARLVLARVAAWAAERGARSTYVQVADTNAVARAALRVRRVRPPPPATTTWRTTDRLRPPA